MQLIDRAIKVLGCTDDSGLAKRLGKDKSTISKWRSSGAIPAKAEKELLELIGEGLQEVISDNVVTIPLYKAEALGTISGVGRINGTDVVESYFSFTREYARVTFGTTANLVCLKAAGDSMTPAIFPGDVMVIDRTDMMLERDGAPYVIQIGETTVVKRLQRLSKSLIRFTSDNPHGWNRDFSLAELEIEGTTIVGRVVAVMKMV